MRDIRLFERFADYEAFVREEVFADPRIPAHPYYDRLIAFVLDHRAPLFYDVSHRGEHFGFSATHHFQTLREYPGPTHAALFHLHDFTHLLFAFPHDLQSVGVDAFTRVFVHQERLASNESEILVHYRIPELRHDFWPERRLFVDVLRERAIPRPRATALLGLRARLALDDAFGDAYLPEDPELREWFRRWRVLTPRWCATRHARQAAYRVPRFPFPRLQAGTYEAEIARYAPVRSQSRYEELVLANLAMGFALAGLDDPPRRFAEAPAAVERLEGKVLLAGQPPQVR